MKRIPELIANFEGMNEYARELLCDLAKSFRERFPAPPPPRRRNGNRARVSERQRG